MGETHSTSQHKVPQRCLITARLPAFCLAAVPVLQAQVNEYLASQGKETHTAAVIHSNPDQSKHLETARMKVNSLWIDLVNLRSETYADGSRIPKMEFGTPLQDAMRR
jgi:tRNA nucleotidyltransferase/poly(A) polymerase